MPSVVSVVAWPGDLVADAVEEALRARRRPVLRLEPSTLSGRRVSLDQEGLSVERRRVCSVLWRARPDSHFSLDFVEEDRLFADVETRAFWLAALHSESLAAPFRPEAAAFFTGGGWLLWRRRLIASGVHVSPLAYGATASDGYWLPYQHDVVRPGVGPPAAGMLGAATVHRERGSRVLLVAREVIDVDTGRGSSSPNALDAAVALRDAGVAFAEVGLDSDDAVLTVDPFPVVHDSALVARVADQLAESLDAAAHRR